MWPCSGHYRISKLSCKQRGTKTDSAPSGAGPSCSCPCTTCDCCWIQGLGLCPQAMMPHWATDIIVTTCISRVISKLIQTLVQTAWHLQPIWSSGGCKLLLWVMQHRPGVGCPTLEASTLARKLRRVQLTLLHLLFSCKCSDFIFPIQKVTPFLCLIYIYTYNIYITTKQDYQPLLRCNSKSGHWTFGLEGTSGGRQFHLLLGWLWDLSDQGTQVLSR